METPIFSEFGEVAEWSIVQHWKCCVFRKGDPGFESLPLRQSKIALASRCNDDLRERFC